MTYTVYGHTQHTITRDQYNDRSKVSITWMGLSPEHKGMANQFVIDYDEDGDIDGIDKGLAILAPINIACSTMDDAVLKNRFSDIINKNDGNALYYIKNSNYFGIYYYKGMIHSITIVATRNPSRPNYVADAGIRNPNPRYFTGPWSIQ